MWKTAAFVACVVLGGAWAQAQPATDSSADQDLAMVKRAVEKDDDGPVAPRVRAQGSAEPRWFRLRIEERKGARVKVNLPLAVVRGLADDLPADWACGRRHHRTCKLRLSEVLDQLDGGQDLVEVKDADATIRIWID